LHWFCLVTTLSSIPACPADISQYQIVCKHPTVMPLQSSMEYPRKRQAEGKSHEHARMLSSNLADGTFYASTDNYPQISTGTLLSTTATLGTGHRRVPSQDESTSNYSSTSILKATAIYFFALFMLDPQRTLALALMILSFAPYPAWHHRATIFIPLLFPTPPFAKVQVVTFLGLVSSLAPVAEYGRG